MLIATHGRAERPAPAREPLGHDRPPPASPALQRLPPLRDIPGLVLPRPRERRALNGGDSGGNRGAPSVNPGMRDQSTEPPTKRPPRPPSPPSGGAGQPEPEERNAPP